MYFISLNSISFLWSKSFVLSIEVDSISGVKRLLPSKERPIDSIINVGVRKIEPTKKYKKSRA